MKISLSGKCWQRFSEKNGEENSQVLFFKSCLLKDASIGLLEFAEQKPVLFMVPNIFVTPIC